MINKKTKGLRKLLSIHIKLLIAGLAIGFIYHELFQERSPTATWQEFTDTIHNRGSIAAFALAMLLMPLNWGLESLKWWKLSLKVQSINFYQAFAGVLSGVTVSIFTPNRTGDFAGRVLYLKPQHRVQGALINSIASLAQLIVTLLAGTTALIFALKAFPTWAGTLESTGLPTLNTAALIAVLSPLMALLGFLYLRLPKLSDWLHKLPFLKRFQRYTRVFGYYRKRELVEVFLLSLVRYFVFLLQYYCLLRAFGISIPFFQGLAVIALIYLVMTVVPTIALTEPGLKGAVAIALIGGIFGQSTGVLFASLSLWVINLAIPALMGSLLVFRTRIFPQAPPG